MRMACEVDGVHRTAGTDMDDHGNVSREDVAPSLGDLFAFGDGEELAFPVPPQR